MSATNRGSPRVDLDAYYTPASAIVSLMDVIPDEKVDLVRTVLEPCAGPGSILQNAIKWRFPKARLTIIDAAFGDDFLVTEFPESQFDLCITNPPYSLAREFVDRILLLSRSAAILLRLNFLASQRRKEWWQHHLPQNLLVLSVRPSFTGTGTDATDYAWFCWGPVFAHLRPIEVV